MALSNEQKKAYRAIGHRLKPIVTIAGNGLSPSVLEELNRALDDHELIKVKIVVGDRTNKAAMVIELQDQTGALLVQQIGNIALILRNNPDAKPELSNLTGY